MAEVAAMAKHIEKEEGLARGAEMDRAGWQRQEWRGINMQNDSSSNSISSLARKEQCDFQSKKRSATAILRLIIQEIHVRASLFPKLVRNLKKLNWYPD